MMKLFGIDRARIGRMLVTSGIVFWGLRCAGIMLNIAPEIMYLMTAMVTAGVIGQALSATDTMQSFKQCFMLPFERQKLAFMCVGALGAYAIITKVVLLWAVVWAITPWRIEVIVGNVLCAGNVVLFLSLMRLWTKGRVGGWLWIMGVGVGIFYLPDIWRCVLLIANALLTVVFLLRADVYRFYQPHCALVRSEGGSERWLMGSYFCRYLLADKSYLVNMGVFIGVAAILPVFLPQMIGDLAWAMGLAVLSFNTPLGILLSGDRALAQSVRTLPGQKKAFCLPYGIFVLFINLAVEAIFCTAWFWQMGAPGGYAGLMVPILAVQNAIGTVLLEWFYPLRRWKVRNDLWHHPRKYIMPTFLLMLAVLLESYPWLLGVWSGILLVEGVLLLRWCAND